MWGWEYEGSDRAVDLAIKRLRKALKEWDEAEGEIKTLRGLGYQLSVQKISEYPYFNIGRADIY